MSHCILGIFWGAYDTGPNTTRLKGEGIRKRDRLPILYCQKSYDTIAKGTFLALLLLYGDQENDHFRPNRKTSIDIRIQ